MPGTTFEISGDGIFNFSPIKQNFIASVDRGGGANLVSSGRIVAGPTIMGPVTLTQQACDAATGNPGSVQFQGGAFAGDATIHNLGATVAGGVGGRTDFFDGPTTADQGTIINEGATVSGATGGTCSFSWASPSAGNA